MDRAPSPDRGGPDAPGPAPGRGRLARFAAGRRRTVALAIALPTLALTARLAAGPEHPMTGGCADAGTDFCVFWGAAKLALAGDALAVFDQDTLAAAVFALWRSARAGADRKAALLVAAALLATPDLWYYATALLALAPALAAPLALALPVFTALALMAALGPPAAPMHTVAAAAGPAPR